jgi:Gamma tubulin complex component C-terminal
MDAQDESTVRLAEEKLDLLTADFRERHRYLLRVLTARTLKIGGYSALHHLVMRLNFNGFYPDTTA